MIILPLGHAPDVMRHGQDGATVEQDLEDLIVIPVGGQNERRDLGCEGRRVTVGLLP